MGSKRAHNKQSKIVRARTVGYRARSETKTGRNVLKRRRAKGRTALAATSVSNSKTLSRAVKNKALPRRRT